MAIPKKVRDIVAARSRGVCEGCLSARATEMHHRRFKSRGGKDEVSNLLHLCGWGNHTGCHGLAHSGISGTRRGWAIPSGLEHPSSFAYQDSNSQWWLLDNDGGRKSTDRPDC